MIVKLVPKGRTAATVENDFWGFQNTVLGIRTASVAWLESLHQGNTILNYGEIRRKIKREKILRSEFAKWLMFQHRNLNNIWVLCVLCHVLIHYIKLFMSVFTLFRAHNTIKIVNKLR